MLDLTARLSYPKNGFSLVIDPEACTGCGACLDVCPHDVLALEGRQAVVGSRERCMECGACQRNCPAGAIHVATGVGCVAAITRSLLSSKASGCGCQAGSGRSRCG